MSDPYYSAEELRAKADEIIDLAVQKRQEEINDWLEKNGYKFDQGEEPVFDNGTPIPDGAEVREGYQWIKDSFEAFCHPGFEGFADVSESADGMITAAGRLGANVSIDGDMSSEVSVSEEGVPDFGDVDSGILQVQPAMNEAGEWDGVFADQLHGVVLPPLPVVASNQGLALGALAQMLSDAKLLYQIQRRDVSQVADDTLSALRLSGSCRPVHMKTALKILGVVLEVVSVGMASPLVKFAEGAKWEEFMVGQALSHTKSQAGSAMSGIPEEDIPLGASSVDGVLSNMSDALAKISMTRNDSELVVIEALDACLESLTAAREASDGTLSPIVPLRPDLANATTAEDAMAGLKILK